MTINKTKTVGKLLSNCQEQLGFLKSLELTTAVEVRSRSTKRAPLPG